MSAVDLIDRLAEHKTWPPRRGELAWLVAQRLRHREEGGVLSPRGIPVAGLFVVLTGHIAIFVDRGAGRHKVLESRAGAVTGMLPYSRLVGPPGDSLAQEPTEILVVPRDDLAAMIRDCHEITSILVHKMLDRPGLHVEQSAR
jgi:CRP-like cAMP-binding protein